MLHEDEAAIGRDDEVGLVDEAEGPPGQVRPDGLTDALLARLEESLGQKIDVKIAEAPATQPNPVPAFNAPGYASVAPPASAAPKPSQRGIAPMPPRVGPRPPMT